MLQEGEWSLPFHSIGDIPEALREQSYRHCESFFPPSQSPLPVATL